MLIEELEVPVPVPVTEPFVAKDVLPVWRKIYNYVRSLDVDEVVTYEELLEVSETELVSRVQSEVQRVIKELLDVDKRTLENVRGQGYRVVRAEEQLRLARKHQKKANRSTKRSFSNVTNVDHNALTPEQSKVFEKSANSLSAVLSLSNAESRKQAKLERSLGAILTQR